MQAFWNAAAAREDLGQLELVTLAKQRDSATWSTIFSQYYDSVYRYLFGRLGRREEAEDLASQVFLEALQSIDSFVDMGRPLAAWLFGIARNLANNTVRRRQRQGPMDSLNGEDSQEAPSLPGGLSADSLDLIAGLDSLTREQRDVIVLRFFVGLSAREAGQVLGKNETAVYALQVRALAALRRRLSDESPSRREAA